MNYPTKIALFMSLFLAFESNAQEKKKPISIGGDMGIWYDGYGLNKAPSSSVPDFYQATVIIHTTMTLNAMWC